MSNAGVCTGAFVPVLDDVSWRPPGFTPAGDEHGERVARPPRADADA